MRDLELTLWSTAISLCVDMGFLWDLGVVWGKPESQGPALSQAVPPWLGDTASGQTLLPHPGEGTRELAMYWGCPGGGGGVLRQRRRTPSYVWDGFVNTWKDSAPRGQHGGHRRAPVRRPLKGAHWPTTPDSCTFKTCSRVSPSLPLPGCPWPMARHIEGTRPRPHLPSTGPLPRAVFA